MSLVRTDIQGIRGVPIHSFDKYLIDTHSLPRDFPRNLGYSMNRTEKLLVIMEVAFLRERNGNKMSIINKNITN